MTTVIRGEMNSWQATLGRAGQEHIIAKCGSHTGHSLNAVAFCDGPETASVLVGALALLKRIHDNWLDPSKEDNLGRSLSINEDMLAAKSLLVRAGLVE